MQAAQSTVFHFLEGQNYDCVQCGKGCTTDWRVSVDPTTRRTVKDSAIELRVIQEYGQAWIDPEHTGDARELTDESFVGRKPDGSCVFLNPQKLCGIHAEMGGPSKPVVCRMYPFEPVPTPDGMFVSVSFSCTAVQQNHGRPLEAHREDLLQLFKQVEFRSSGFEPKVVYEHVSVDWEGYKALDTFLQDQMVLSNPEMALGQAIWAVCEEIAACDGPTLLDGARMKAALTRQKPGRLEQDPMITASVEFVLLTTLAFLEVELPERRKLVESIASHKQFSLARWHWRGTIDELDASQRERVGDRFEHQIKRYLKALVFGKQLLQAGSLLSSLSALYLLPRVLRLYTTVFATTGPATDAEFFQAVDICESELVTHAHGMNSFFDAFARSFVGQVGVLIRTP
jgi:Fe-S-cluster containining protein